MFSNTALSPVFTMVIARIGQTFAHVPQPMHSSGARSAAMVRMSPRFFGRVIVRQSAGQFSTHTEQPAQRIGSIAGFSQSLFGVFLAIFPAGSTIAPLAQSFPHSPQPTHLSASMRWRSFSAPLIAPTGQFFAHSVQPMQFSLIE